MSALAVASIEAQGLSYGALVWGQLRKNPVAIFGLWSIAGLFLLAIFLPLLCLNVPLLLIDQAGLRLPLVTELFNRLLFESAVDIFFNLLMLLAPLYLAAFWLGRRAGQGSARLLLALVALHSLLFAAMTQERIVGTANPLYHRAPLVDWQARVAARQAAGESVFAIFPPYPTNYRATDPGASVQPPSRSHWFGTDVEGRDVFARMLYGTRISLTIGVVAVAIFTAIGVVLGALAGYLGGRVDLWISRLIEVMICFPSFFLILTLAALVAERSIFHVMVIIGITSWTGVARLVRAEFLKQKTLDYVQAARALGLSQLRIMFRHVLPNAMAPVLVTATFGVASAILIESSLAFLGIGDPSAPSWGELLNVGRVEQKLWLILVPGCAIFFVVSVFNLVGEGLRDALDPQLRR
jgi:peptide/nickel transport system permease protein